TEDGLRRSESGYWIVKYLGRGFYKMTAAVSALLVSSQVIFMSDPQYCQEATFGFTTSFYTGEGYFFTPFQWPTPIPAAVMSERKTHSDLLRDIFGNPFRPVALDPRWLTASVLDLARVTYDERAFERMPILADALMDAGCDNDDILNHCRGTCPHV